jgi:O-antigen/teichoic acid export membrane protein
MSLSIVSLIGSAAMSWIATKNWKYGQLVAKGEYAELDRVFLRGLIPSLAMVVAGGVVLEVAVITLVYAGHRWSGRVVDPVTFSLLIATALAAHVANSQAMYLRAHKREPLLPVTLLTAVFLTVGIFAVAPRYGPLGVAVCYFAVTLVFGIGLGSWIFYKKRQEWHSGIVRQEGSGVIPGNSRPCHSHVISEHFSAGARIDDTSTDQYPRDNYPANK